MSSQSEQKHSSLNWNGYADNFAIVFNELLEQQEMVDVTLVADGYMFNAHRLVLSALSPYFRQMFAQAPANQRAYVIMSDVTKQTMTDLLTFCYTGEVNIDPKSLADFLQTTKRLKIKGLADFKYSQSCVQEQPMPSIYNNKPAHNGVQFQTTRINSVQHSKTANNKTDSANINQPFSNGSTMHGDDFNWEHFSNPDDENISFGMDGNGVENSYDLVMNQKYNVDDWDMEYENNLCKGNGMAVDGSNDGHSIPKRAKRNSGKSEYDIIADIQTDLNGREYLIINNYTFWKQGKPNGRDQQRWRCNKCNSHKCRASANTMDVDGVFMMKINIAEHTHEPAE